MMTEINSDIIARVLEFFNKAHDSGEIVSRIKDDITYGKVGYGIRPSLARRILVARNALPNRRFDSLKQIDSIQGIGPDTLHDILFSFRDDEPGDMSFRAEIEGMNPELRLEIGGFESDTGIIESGGEPAWIRKTMGRTNYANLVLRHRLSGNDDIWQWRQQVADGRIERKTINIIALDVNGDEVARFKAFETWPCFWKVSVSNAVGVKTIIEEIRVVVERIERESK